MEDTVLAYLAGAMDSDGFFGIRRSTYHRRIRGDAKNPVYSERIGLKQVSDDIPNLLRECFGGYITVQKPQTGNSKPLYSYGASNKIAAAACRALLPFLRVKKRQAKIVLELRESKEGPYWKHGYWFEQEFPNWPSMELITFDQTAEMLGHRNPSSVGQAVRNGTLLAIPYDHSGRSQPRVPLLLVERLLGSLASDGRARCQAPQLVAWRERLWQRLRELNKIGISGTPIYHRTGPYALLE